MQKLTVKKLNLEEPYVEPIKDELNVKEVIEDRNLSVEILLDLDLTPELIEEGKLRDAIRAIQDMRKEKGLKPSEIMEYSPQDSEKEFFKKYTTEIEGTTKIKIGR